MGLSLRGVSWGLSVNICDDAMGRRVECVLCVYEGRGDGVLVGGAL